MMPLFKKKNRQSFFNAFSTILLKLKKLLIKRLLLTTVLSPALCMGVTIDTLNLLGMVPDSKILLIIIFKGFVGNNFVS